MTHSFLVFRLVSVGRLEKAMELGKDTFYMLPSDNNCVHCLFNDLQVREGGRTTLDVYYESLCPDSRRFIMTQLFPSWNKINSFVNVRLVPFGKASVSTQTSNNINIKYSFSLFVFHFFFINFNSWKEIHYNF